MSDTNIFSRNLVILTFEGVQSLDVTGPLEVFSLCNSLSEPKGSPPKYSIHLATVYGGNITTSSGLVIADTKSLSELPSSIDTLIITGGNEATLRDQRLINSVLPWLIKTIPNVRHTASICTGALVLAATGFLDFKRATTHWNFARTLEKLFPNVKLEIDAIYVDEHPLYTSAGITAGVDLCLRLIEKDFGSKIAVDIAKELVLFLRRPGGQSQFSNGLSLTYQSDSKIANLISSILDNPKKHLRVSDMAELCGYSIRNFARIFQKETGVSPAAFVERARVEKAKILLEVSDLPLKQITEMSGFKSLDSFHRSFHKIAHTTPGFYRKRFTHQV